MSSGNHEGIRNRFLEKFREYQSDYLDDLPEAILQIGDPDYYRYKCRTNFFNGVHGSIMVLLRLGILPETADIRNFRRYIQEDRNWLARATERDIVILNYTIDRVISILEGKQGTNPDQSTMLELDTGDTVLV